MTESRGIRVRRGTRQRWLAENGGKHFCQCGCGGPIPLRAWHFNVGVPAYLLGHNSRVNPPQPRKERPAPIPCACGCGELAAPGRCYISGHNTRVRLDTAETRARKAAGKLGSANPMYGKFGPASPSWKGGRQLTADGYILVYAPDHPRAAKRYVMEHRLVVEAHLREHDPRSPFLEDGRLTADCHVHHINEVKDDNRLENLRAMTAAEHTRLHLLDARFPGRC